MRNGQKIPQFSRLSALTRARRAEKNYVFTCHNSLLLGEIRKNRFRSTLRTVVVRRLLLKFDFIGHEHYNAQNHE